MSQLDMLKQFYQILEGNIKEKNDSVIVITRDGILEECFLEEKPYNHAVLTCYIGIKLHFPCVETPFPIVAGRHLAKYGCIVLQVHKAGNCICFFPSNITEIQYCLLAQKLNEMKHFDYQYDGCKQIEGFVSVDAVLNYVKSIVDKCNNIEENCYQKKLKK